MATVVPGVFVETTLDLAVDVFDVEPSAAEIDVDVDPLSPSETFREVVDDVGAGWASRSVCRPEPAGEVAAPVVDGASVTDVFGVPVPCAVLLGSRSRSIGGVGDTAPSETDDLSTDVWRSRTLVASTGTDGCRRVVVELLMSGIGVAPDPLVSAGDENTVVVVPCCSAAVGSVSGPGAAVVTVGSSVASGPNSRAVVVAVKTAGRELSTVWTPPSRDIPTATIAARIGVPSTNPNIAPLLRLIMYPGIGALQRPP